MNDDYSFPNRFLRLDQVTKMISLSKTKIYDMQAKGTFPQSFQIAGRAVGWNEADILCWMNVVLREAKTTQ
jgi:prophage regulatory protein